MKKTLSAVLSAAAAWLLLLAMLLAGVFVCTTSTAFYEHEYEKYGNAAAIGISDEGLMEVTEGLLDYLWGKRDTLDMQAEIGGEMREVFTQREKDHMVDVRYLIELARAALFVALPLGIVVWIAAVLFSRKEKNGLKVCGVGYLAGAGLLFVAVGIVVLLAMRDFTAVFIKFHEIFFTNDLWLLNADDMLILMVPEPFFVDCAALIAVVFGLVFALTAGLSVWMICRKGKKRCDDLPIQAISDANGDDFYKIEESGSTERPDASEIFARMGLEDGDEEEEPEAIPAAPTVFAPVDLPVVEETPVQPEPDVAVMPPVIASDMPVKVEGFNDVSVRFEMKLDLKVEKTEDGKILLTMDPARKPQVQLSSDPGQLTFTIYDEIAALEAPKPALMESGADDNKPAVVTGPAPSPEELLRQMDELMKGFPKESGEDKA